MGREDPPTCQRDSDCKKKCNMETMTCQKACDDSNPCSGQDVCIEDVCVKPQSEEKKDDKKDMKKEEPKKDKEKKDEDKDEKKDKKKKEENDKKEDPKGVKGKPAGKEQKECHMVVMDADDGLVVKVQGDETEVTEIA